MEIASFAGFGAAVVIGASWMLKFIMARLSKLEDDYRTGDTGDTPETKTTRS